MRYPLVKGRRALTTALLGCVGMASGLSCGENAPPAEKPAASGQMQPANPNDAAAQPPRPDFMTPHAAAGANGASGGLGSLASLGGGQPRVVVGGGATISDPALSDPAEVALVPAGPRKLPSVPPPTAAAETPPGLTVAPPTAAPVRPAMDRRTVPPPGFDFGARPSGGGPVPTPAPSAPAPGPRNTPALPPPPKATSAELAAIPKDARWTILCSTLGGEGHIQQANEYKRLLAQRTGLRDWHILHGEKESAVFYGYYASLDPKEADGVRAQADKAKLANLADPAGEKVLRSVFFTPLDSPDPIAPPEWDLALKDRDRAFNDPNRAFWSVEIAAFKDNPQRKQAAVEAARELREKGIEAYYFHGETASSVCVGSWRRTAVKEQAVDPFERVSPSDTLLVMDKPLPGQLTGELRDPDGNHIHALAARADIQDPTLMDTLRNQYPYHSLNYEVLGRKKKDPKTGRDLIDPKTGKPLQYLDRSFMVMVPHKTPDEEMIEAQQRQANNLANPFGAQQAPPGLQVGPANPAGVPAAAPSGGRLRSLNR